MNDPISVVHISNFLSDGQQDCLLCGERLTVRGLKPFAPARMVRVTAAPGTRSLAIVDQAKAEELCRPLPLNRSR